MDIQTLAHETVRAESDARAANVRALRALVDLVRPVAGVIAAGRSAVLGRSEWEGDEPVTLDTEESITLLDWHDDVTHDHHFNNAAARAGPNGAVNFGLHDCD